MITIPESGMTFGPFADTHCFKIENSPLHQSAQPGIQIAEFILVRDGKEAEPQQVWIVEAKSSAPNPKSNIPDTDKKLAAYIEDIRDKLLNALTLGITARLGRHAKAGQTLPAAFAQIPVDQAVFRLILVIKGHEKMWLPPLKDALERALRVTARTWDLGASSVVVLNDSMARSHGLIQ